jgi:hypothetical protein
MDIAPLLYRNTMIEVKRRFRAVDRVLGAKKPRTLNSEFDNEFMWLQLRKIIELVTFGGIMADESRYAALQALLKHRDYRLDSKVNKILPKLAEITPHYLPIPIGEQTTSADGVIQFQQGAAEQTLLRFLDIFNAAGLYLHVPNPLAFETLADFRQALDVARQRLEVELQYLKAVLWKHAKIGLAFDGAVDLPGQAGNPDRAWLVDFGKPDSDDIQMFFASGQD